jgi:predicted DNA-binding transcriptional regulator AlpA
MNVSRRLPTAVPRLDECVVDPSLARRLPRETALALLANLSVVQAALVARILAEPAPTLGAHPGSAESDRLLTPEETAQRLGQTRRWLYRHAETLPFARRLSRKALRFSERGLERWLAARR